MLDQQGYDTVALPTQYKDIPYNLRWVVRERYIRQQKGLCMFCQTPLNTAPKQDKKLNLRLFPPGFLKNPIHLQHCHDSGLTEGAVHAYCNGIMWQYYRR